ncbi:DNA-processing protein DprA [Paracoccus ravus]|uniref:DNA-processing protein DprA n=1 Tax=Paracoccus ravus TaxID=2447760 RepID=UPI00106E3A5D|nr:DNA-processing protein DprA [Paracoccus ravus]
MARAVPIVTDRPDRGFDRVATLRLIRSRRVGPATFHRLLAEYGGVEAALAALPQIARDAGLADYSPCPLSVAMAEIEAGSRAGARLICWGDADYPPHLRDIADAPPVLWIRGNPAVLSLVPIAVVGARNASSLGLRMARGMSAGLAAAGLGVIAGLARGVDSVAHEAALATGTIAVMAGGINRVYPRENARLAEAICETGLLISEQAPGTEAVARHFPARNRIISGLSQAVVVIEAAHRSGSLLTAKAALDQGREVMAVPGHPMDARAAGCNGLIRDGATLVRHSEDVLAALNIDTQAVPHPRRDRAAGATSPVSSSAALSRHRHEAADIATFPAQGTAPAPPPPAAEDRGGPAQLETRILAMLGPSPTEENLLIRDLGIPAATIVPAILTLELAGRVQRLAGGRIALSGS